MIVNIQTVTPNNKYTIDTDPSVTVTDLKQQIIRTCAFATSTDVKLVYGGKILTDDTKTLNDYNIKDSYTIIAIPKIIEPKEDQSEWTDDESDDSDESDGEQDDGPNNDPVNPNNNQHLDNDPETDSGDESDSDDDEQNNVPLIFGEMVQALNTLVASVPILTADDNVNIETLQSLGFSEADARASYIINNRNMELAANMLMDI